MKRVVLDTNVLLVSISSRSAIHEVFRSLIDKKYSLCVTTEILAEYAEVIERHMGKDTSKRILDSLLQLSNIEFITSYFRFQLLQDPDDNKFVDCAIAANASFLVTEDRDFDPLKSIEFPKVMVIKVDSFLSWLKQN